MLHLLKLEWKKFKNNAVVNLFGLMFIITLPTVIFAGKEIKNLPAPLPSNSIFFNFPTVWDYQGYIGNWLVFFFLGFVVIYIITSEVGFKTMRQNIITGMTRKGYFLAKLYTIISLSLAATLLYTIICFLIGAFHAEEFSISAAFDNNYAIPRFFLMCMGYLSFGLMIAFLIRKSGIAIFTYISYIIFIEPLIKWNIHFRLFKNASVNYWPMNTIEDLTPLPLFRYVENIPRQDLDFAFLMPYSHAMLFSTIYILIFIAIAYRSFLKRDI
jgi:ABC-type transport system involved in multi-copper enzyme maturation permease subunit